MRHSPFKEYKVTPRQVERAAARDIAAIKKDRQTDRLKPWIRDLLGGLHPQSRARPLGLPQPVYRLIFARKDSENGITIKM